MLSNLTEYAKTEVQSLRELGVSASKQNKFLSSINEKIRALGGAPSWWDKIKAFFADVFGLQEPSIQVIIKDDAAETAAIPEKPSSFSPPADPLPAQETKTVELEDQPIPDDPALQEQLKNLILTQKVEAANNDLPTLNDLTKEDSEIALTYEIRNLAASLENNPAKIFNFIRNQISYEPYAGSKKGALGCLKERICNDTDTSSLLIAILRASGIPARYKTSPIIASKEQLTSLLRTKDLKAAYYALGSSGVVVAVPPDSVQFTEGKDFLEKADFSKINTLYLEWTYVQMFYEYDERGANVSNILPLSDIDSDQKLQETLVSYPKKSWVSIDATLKPSIHNQKQVLQDSTDFSADAFPSTYLQSNTDTSPLATYESILKAKTGKDIKDFRSTWTLEPWDISIIPPTLPFIELRKEVISSTNYKDGKTRTITIEQTTASALPDDRKNAVTISLLKGDKPILSHIFFASELPDSGISLDYQGFQDVDRTVIEKAGGIHNTNSSVVDIVPVFSLGATQIIGKEPISIGDLLILRFSPSRGDVKLIEKEKFSIAGNSEGIAITFSPRASQPTHLTSPSAILLAGNTAIAREYLKTIFQKQDILSSELNHQYGINFARAVVTQNRILTRDESGNPSTFDFQGLSIDASYEYLDYSSSDTFNKHQKDFRVISGMDASYYEAQTLTNLTGMEAISTVTGLQHAYRNPGTYQVKTITKQNKQDIENLNLSENTKAKMRQEVDTDHTITTPTTTVTKGGWTGTLYMSLAKDYDSDLYAIGEQVIGNGGFTVGKVQLASWQNDNSETQYAYQLDKGPDRFIYKDDPSKNIMCLLPIELYQAIEQGKLAPGWSLKKYGKPCMDEGPNIFSEASDHYFVVATDGAYLLDTADGYAYWITNDEILSPFISSLQTHGLDSNMSMRKLFPYWGTYVNEIRDGKELLSLDVFNPRSKQVFPIEAEMAYKYMSSELIQKKYIPYHLKYPTSSMIEESAVSSKGTVGMVQQFNNGRMYLYFDGRREFSTKTFIVYGQWKAKFDELGGIKAVGYPSSDVAHVFTPNNTLEQQFELFNCELSGGDSIDCKKRTASSDRLYGLEKYYDSTALNVIPFVLANNDSIIGSYKKFLEGIDQAQNTGSVRYAYCLLSKAKNFNSYSLPKSFLANLSCLSQLVWGDIRDIQAKKEYVQKQLTFFESQNEQEYFLLALLRDEIEKHVEKADVNRDEWLGYVSVDLGTFLIPVGSISKGGEKIFKKIAVDATERYAKELAAKQISKGAFLREVEKSIIKGAEAYGGKNLTKEQLGTISEKALLSSLSKSGVTYVTRQELDIPIDLAQQLTGKWYKATSLDTADSFAKHFIKHFPEKGKPVVKNSEVEYTKQMQEYFEDSTRFFDKYDGTGQKIKSGIGQNREESGWLIRQSDGRGGYFTAEDHPLGLGKVITFWYKN